MPLTICRSLPQDADALIDLQNRAFRFDPECPGVNVSRENMLETIRKYHRYTLWEDELVVGCISVHVLGHGDYWLGCLCVSPEKQNRHYGGRAMEFLWQAYPDAVHWALDTPAADLRNQHFYRSHGFRITSGHLEGPVNIVVLERSEVVQEQPPCAQERLSLLLEACQSLDGTVRLTSEGCLCLKDNAEKRLNLTLFSRQIPDAKKLRALAPSGTLELDGVTVTLRSVPESQTLTPGMRVLYEA